MRLAAYAVALFFGLLVMPVMAGEAEIAAIKAVLAASPVDVGLFSADESAAAAAYAGVPGKLARGG